MKADTRITDSPDVQYRGIFLNDEEKLNEWAKAHTQDGTIGPDTYKHIFELILRLKGNYLWPAMHVNGFNNNPENARLAEEYGVVMGSSHPEMFLRNNNMEWPEWKQNYDAIHHTDVKYDYTVSPEAVLQYWKDSLTRNMKYESQWTLGMRGAHDEPFTTANINNGTFPGATETERKVNLLDKIIKDQQGMMKDVLGEEGYQNAFKMFIPYKEVLPLYNAGLEVPDDLTIMWVDDNHGYVRRLPNEEERQRSGGNGLYYHVSYWAPADQSYVWLGTTPLALMAEELQKSYESGIQKAWILNVGDLKPLEGEMDFFIKYGWDVHKYENNPNQFLHDWVSSQYGRQYADEVTDIVNTYYQLTSNRRLEHMKVDVFDQLHYGDEASKRMLKYQGIFDRANAVYNSLPEQMRDGFYEQVLCKIRWAYYVNKAFYYADRSNMAYDQGRFSSANTFLKLSQDADQKKKEEIAYYNKGLAGGKWDRILDPETHAPPVISQWPEGSPALVLGDPEMGAIVQGEERVQDHSVLEFSEFGQGGKYIEIFNKGAESLEWTASTDKDWIQLSQTSGTIMDEERIWVNINNLSSHKGESGLIVLKSGETEKSITVNIDETSVGLEQVKGYAEADGYVSMEAEHYSRKNDAGALKWQEIYNLGRTKGNVMRSYNPSLTRVPEDQIQQSAPSLEYDVQFEHAGNFPMEIYRVPTLDSTGTIKFAVSIDAEDPIIVSSKAVDEGQGTDWVPNLFRHIEKHVIDVNIPTVGKHTVKLWMIDNDIMIDKMVIYTDGKGILYSDNGPDESYNSVYNDTFSIGYELLPHTSVAQTKKDETASWGSGAILEKDGKVFIEPEMAIENSEYAKVVAKSGNSWRITQSDTGYAMRLPDQGAIWRDASDLVSKSPEMQFKIKFTTPGTYNVWMRTRIIDDASDSIYGGIDGVYKATSFDSSQLWSYERDEKWMWPRKNGTISVPSAGEHTFNIWMREDGISVDRIYITKTSENPPSDTNWVVSEREFENPDSIYENKLTTAIQAAEESLEQAPVPLGTELGSYGQAEYDLVLSSLEELKKLKESGSKDMPAIDNAIEKLTDAERQLRNSQNLDDGPFQYVAYQDFDRNELGKLPFGFNVQSITNGGEAVVAEEDGNRFVRFTSSNISGTQALLQLPFGDAGAAGEEIVIDLKVRMPQSARFTNLAYISTAPGLYAIAAGFDRNNDQNQKNVMMQDGGSKKMISTFEENKWYNVKFVVNTAKKTYSGYFDNQLVAKDFKFRIPDGDQLNYYSFGLDKQVDGIYDVDDMKVYAAPTADEFAHGMTSLLYKDNEVVLPEYDGYTLEITNSSKPEIISTDGVVTPQKEDAEVNLTIKVTKNNDNSWAETAPITVLVKGSNSSKVEMPTADPAPGTYTSAQEVTLTSATEGAKIYYTTDGSIPTVSSTEYTEAIDVAETMTIKAIAVKHATVGEAVYSSDVATFNYTIGGNKVVIEGPEEASKGSDFDLMYGLSGMDQNVYAQDLTFTYDPSQLEFVSAESVNADEVVIVDKAQTQGQVRFIVATLGQNARLDGSLLKLHWKVKADTQASASTITLAKAFIADEAGREKELVGKSHTVQFSYVAVDKTALLALIANAQSKHDAAAEGTGAGQYPAGSKASLQAAIDQAKAVADNTAATQEQVEQAVNALTAALQAFMDSVITTQPGDVNSDGRYSVGDLAIVAAAYGKTSADPNWSSYMNADLNNDGKIDIEDLAAMAIKILN
ncbi:glycosyl hydrolase 115 family protein [Paenibacillus hexagrammi]|uniref:Glycosyl hydrolase 115 family protein n=1 Tax=Paenibacillus hexagrammi TaxID=2908839 RepID=A0ABY3SCL5_9BACL|nr:glycosyl hydrolase 115 family protein [Paenibacillus sp. YPD9-1]UJF31747.1 glycosyl hydrolase 115 family protein [Paenibacillus sp. YPD9-1]